MSDYMFDEYTYSPATYQLLRDGEVLPLQPKVLEALKFFLDSDGALVTREDLKEALWPNLFVTSNSIEQVVLKLRRALGETQRSSRYLTTVYSKGYRFVAEVQRVAAARSPRTNLPCALPSFVGRAAELESLGSWMRRERLVTVVGMGGAGKTWLAREAASRLAWGEAAPAGGVWSCDLSAARDTLGVLGMIYAGLQLAPQRAQTIGELMRHLLVRLSAEPVLLLLDNAEQVAAEVAEIVDALLHGSAGLTVVVTSRERLQISAERRFDVGPLPLHEGVTLLRARAEAAQTGLGALDEGYACAIVQRLEGIPLAITLAAPRLTMMSPEVLLERLSERVSWLHHRSRDLAPRQLSLRASVEWGWSLLDATSQHAAAQCAVFRGGFTLESAQVVLRVADPSRDVSDVLMELRDASMLRTLHAAGEPRFDLPAPVRERALEHLSALGLADEVRHRHLYWAVSLSRRWAGAEREAILAERENVWAAWRYATDPELVVACAELICAMEEGTPAELGEVRARADRVRACTRVALVEDDTRYRETLAVLLEYAEGFEMCAAFPSAAAAVAQAQRAPALPWDIVIMDMKMPGMDGVEGTQRLRSLFPELKVMVLTAYEEPANLLRAICAGADGYLLKNARHAQLLAHLALVRDGGAPMTPGVAASVLRAASAGALALVEREEQILARVADGLDHTQIASEIDASEHSIRTYVRGLYTKLRAPGCLEAVARALAVP